MFAPANQASFTLAIEGLDHDFKVLGFTGREALNQPYSFDVELVSEQPSLELESLLHKPAFLQMSPGGSGIHGLLYRVAQGDAGKRLTRYEITLRPHLAYLEHSVNQRIFQHLTVEQIIVQVLEAHGILSTAYQFQLGGTYPPREYCVQYDETDLHFIQRLCEEEGIHYHFQHSAQGHILAFGDDQVGFPTLAPIAYQQDAGMVADNPVIKRFSLRQETRSSRVTRRDYDFEKPSLTLEGAAQSQVLPDLEDYDYPGRFTKQARGNLLASRALERHRSDYALAHGRSDQPSLLSGHFITLSNHPNAQWNDLWLINEVRHEGKQPQVLEESVTSDTGDNPDDFDHGYRNTFTATPWEVIHRPPLIHQKPRILGSQSAVVTGPEGDEIHCDAYGRVKVVFHWDRAGIVTDKSSCWLRVSSSWSGAKYGGIVIPRIGMEVLVSFLEGDPDQPLISGCLYHKENSVPYPLPANKTVSTFKTLSSPGGAGFNELRIEDKTGQEQIFIHAERNWDQAIEHDQKITVHNERHDTVTANSYSAFKAEEHRTTHADRKVEVRANDHLTVANNQHVKIDNSQFVDAGQEIHLSSGQKIVFEAGSELTLKVGGSFIKIDPSGLTLVSPNVYINSGGSPGIGTGAAPLLPGLVLPADTDVPGEVLIAAQKETMLEKHSICAACEAAEQEATHGAS
ncbi:MAG: type VI secretion system tip protein VgrG [Pseudomonadaceae bacterium]|nr:type VI secretion system tip protein VgrG [Pseudomonadaceae bacterium]